jgi:CubicO group peptidase (beta-lactamase class C family)
MVQELRKLSALVVSALLILGGCATEQPVVPSPSPSSATIASIVLDDFESGGLDAWRLIDSGNGRWFVYEDGAFSPDPLHEAVMAMFRVPDPPQGRYALTSDSIGAGTHVLYRDVRLDGRLRLHATPFYVSHGHPPFNEPATFAHDGPTTLQQFRIDVMDPAAPIDSVADGDVLVNVFRTTPAGPVVQPAREVSVDLSHLAGRVVRIRIAKADNRGPLRAGVDDIRFEPVDPNGDASVEFLETPATVSAEALVLERMTQDAAVAALASLTQERVDLDLFSGAVLVARDGHVLIERAWGEADRAAGIPNSIDTRFRIASMNKMFTAVATLQLVEAGCLGLDDPIGRYLSDYPNQDLASSVTVRHLLSHTGGTGDIFGSAFDLHRDELRDHDDYLALYGSRSLDFEPGSRWLYSNYGYVLLGALIEAASGRDYYGYVREHIFEPLGMNRTDSLPESVEVEGRAVGYTRQTEADEWVPNTDTLPWRGTAAGGGYSTVHDLGRFAEGLMSGELISDESLAEATRAHTLEPYGFGFELRGEGALRSFGHGGSAPGMNGDLRIFPELGIVVVALSNLDPQAATEVVEAYELRMPDR